MKFISNGTIWQGPMLEVAEIGTDMPVTLHQFTNGEYNPFVHFRSAEKQGLLTDTPGVV